MKLKLNGHDVDLQRALPMTLGDLEELEGLGLIDEKGEMNVVGPKKLIDLLHYIAHKADENVAREDVRGLPLEQMGKLGEWAKTKLTENPKTKRPS